MRRKGVKNPRAARTRAPAGAPFDPIPSVSLPPVRSHRGERRTRLGCTRVNGPEEPIASDWYVDRLTPDDLFRAIDPLM